MINEPATGIWTLLAPSPALNRHSSSHSGNGWHLADPDYLEAEESIYV